MKIEPLKQFARLREALLSEKATIQTRLAAINSVFEPGAAPARPSGAANVFSSSLDKHATDYLEKELLGHTPRKGTMPAKILKALEKSGAAMQVKDIASAVKGKAVVVNQGCLMLLSKGRLKREGRGQYSVTPDAGA